MKKVRKMIYLLFGTVFLVTSCSQDKNLYDPESTEKVTDLQIPDGFSWATTQNIECSITSPVPTTTSIFLDESCTEKGLIATIPVSQNSTTITLEVPTSSTAIYVQYPTASGKQVKKVDLNSVATKSTVDSKKAVISLPENATTDNNLIFSQTYTPAKNTYGTLMFEDLFPELGDYDLNDFVAYYNTYSYCGNIVGALKGLELNIQIRALGGSLPYQLCVQLGYIPTKYVQDYMTVRCNIDGVTMKLLPQNGDEKAILVITGLDKLKGSGENYYNTVPGTTLSKESELPTITCTIDNNNAYNADEYNAFKNTCDNPSSAFNFFLRNPNNNREIHLRGYEPTKLYTNYANEDPRHKGISYYSNSNLVWGIKVPAAIKHASERTDFTKAYKKFKNWVTTDGKNSKDWYNDPDPNSVITLTE